MTLDLTLIGMVENQEMRHALAEGTHLIGRADDAALKLVQPSVSRRHAEIIVEGTQATVRDLGSHNGTMLNGAKVGDPMPIKAGDVIEVANITFRVEGPGGAGLSMFNESVTLVPSHELSWDEVRQDREAALLRGFHRLLVVGEPTTTPGFGGGGHGEQNQRGHKRSIKKRG